MTSTDLEIQIQEGQYRSALEILEKQIMSNENIIMKLHLLSKLGEYDTIKRYCDQLLENKLANDYFHLQIYLYQAFAYNQKGEYEKCKNSLSSGKKILKQGAILPEHKVNAKVRLLNTEGLYLINIGELQDAEAKYLEALNYLDKLDDIEMKSSLYNNLGIINWHYGKILFAENYFQESLKYKKQANEKKGISGLLNNIGIIHYDKGELKTALSYYLGSLEIDEEIGNKRSIALTSLNIGELYRNLAEYDKSLSYLQNALEIFEIQGDVILRSGTNYQLILTYLELGDMGTADTYLKQLEMIKSSSDNKYVDVFYKISKAVVLKNKQRGRAIYESQKIFEEIVNGDVVVSEITVHALYNLCDLLIHELETYGEKDVLEEIEHYTRILNDIAKNQNSVKLRAQALFIKAKIELLKLNIEEAQNLLIEAQYIAKEHGLTKFAYQVVREHDKLVDKRNHWKSKIIRDASLMSLIDEINFDELFNGLFLNSYNRLQVTSEQPVAILILDDGGNVRLQKHFTDEIEFNHNLVGSFLAALDAFGQSIFKSNRTIEQIKHGEYVIGIKNLEQFYLCYVYKGNSFFVEKRILKLLDFLNEDQKILNELKSSLLTIKLFKYPEFEKLLEEIFDSSHL